MGRFEENSKIWGMEEGTNQRQVSGLAASTEEGLRLVGDPPM